LQRSFAVDHRYSVIERGDFKVPFQIADLPCKTLRGRGKDSRIILCLCAIADAVIAQYDQRRPLPPSLTHSGESRDRAQFRQKFSFAAHDNGGDYTDQLLRVG
jgi:hypothetical protein